MTVDLTRDSFNPANHYLRVLLQQGRVQLDADWNEQIAILLHYMETLAGDLLGPHAGPQRQAGFHITALGSRGGNDIPDLEIGPGRYYVDGILCEIEPWTVTDTPRGHAREREERRVYAGRFVNKTYYTQDRYSLRRPNEAPPVVPPPLPTETPFLVYLDVWERAITSVEDPAIREVALGGADTAARSRVVCQVKAVALQDLPLHGDATDCAAVERGWRDVVDGWQSPHRGLLKAQAQITPDTNTSDPCITAPSARYRGAENQLYRVEVHTGGPATDRQATFKWSRDNGAVIFPLRTVEGRQLILENLGPDTSRSLEKDDWVEIVDDDYALWHGIEPYTPQLRQVANVDRTNLLVTLTDPAPYTVDQDQAKHPLLRRWDQRATPRHALQEGAVPIVEGTWIDLEDGVQIQFQPAAGEAVAKYRPGDYWLIPARTATGDVEWPTVLPGGAAARSRAATEAAPERAALPPHGITHHYAPLAVVTGPHAQQDCRRLFCSLEECSEGSPLG